MVKDSFDSFKRLWLERAAERQSKLDWATTDIISKFGNVLKTETDEEELSPGSVVKVALGERVRSVNVYIEKNGNSPMRLSTRSEWQLKLCKVLVDVCLLDGSTKVNPSVIKETPNHLSFLQLEVHGDRNFVGNTLQWREIGFAIEIKGSNNEVVKKYYAINLHLKRLRRSSCSMVYQHLLQLEERQRLKRLLLKEKKMIFLIISNMSAVAQIRSASADAHRCLGLKFLGTTTDSAHVSVQTYTAIKTKELLVSGREMKILKLL